jgi:hypothetical protein
MAEAGSQMLVAADTTAAARHAAEAGLIAPSSLAEIAEEKQKDM